MAANKHLDLSSLGQGDRELVDRQKEKILASPQFKSAKQMQRFFSYVLEKALHDEAKGLKQYTIAVEALGLPDDFDADSNPAVRILAGRVRERLEEYYKGKVENTPLYIEIPKGSYVPTIKRLTDGVAALDKERDVAEDSESQGPKLGLFCFNDDKQSEESNQLLEHISATLAKELSHFFFSRLYVQIPFLNKKRSELIGKKAMKKYGIDFTLLLYIQELPDNKYELVYRLWDNNLEEVISSEIFNVARGQSDKERSFLLRKIFAVVTDFYQGKLHLNWARRLLANEESIPEKYRVLAYYRYYADDLGRDAFKKAVVQCQRALERNPNDVIANIVFADYCRRDYVYGFDFINNSLEQGKAAAENAIRLRPDSHEAHYALGQILFCQKDWVHSVNEFNLARDICPNHPAIEYGTGFHFCLMGHEKEGLKLAKKAMELSRYYPSWFHITPFLEFYKREKYQEALTEALKIKEPKVYHGPLARCAVYGQLGEMAKAKRELKELLNNVPEFMTTGKGILTRFLGSEELAAKVWQGISKSFKS